MENKIKKILDESATIPVLEVSQPNNYPCVTYHFYNESGSLFGGGTATEESASCQIDIWYKEKTEKVKDTINKIKKAIIKDKYFSFPSMDTMHESDKKIYHTHINFDLIIESED